MRSLMGADILAPTVLLIIASLWDIKYGKFPNWIFLTSLCLSATALGVQHGGSELMKGLGASALFFMILTPLVFLKALGAGDIKLMAVLCLLTNFWTSSSVFLYSLFWGLLFGLIKVVLAGELKTFTQSIVLKTPQVKSHKVPYTIAILFGWLSFLSLGGLV